MNYLKKDYYFYGSFYKVKSNQGSYREKLYMIKHDPEFKEENLKSLDLVCVMMNPGSSTPNDSMYKLNEYDSFSSDKINNLTYTIPDRTQLMVINIIKQIEESTNLKFTNNLIINLSDIRNKNSTDFYKEIGNNLEHSIFSETRTSNLESIINLVNKNTVLLLAWGSSTKMLKLSELFYESNFISKFSLICGYETSKGLFHHPLYMPRDRRDFIINQIKEQLDNK